MFKRDRNEQRRHARKVAERSFNLRQTGLAIKKIFDGILADKPVIHKVFLDFGGHLGESVRRFFKEVKDASFYDIWSFEPHPQNFKKMQEILSGWKNVKCCQKAVVRTANNKTHELRTLYPGTINNADGSTLLKEKTTGGIDYAKAQAVRCIDLKRVLRDGKVELGDYVVLKMNIEGGEYELMQYILDAGLMQYFNEIYVQVHKHKLDALKKQEYVDIETAFAEEAKLHGTKLFVSDKGMSKFNCGGW